VHLGIGTGLPGYLELIQMWMNVMQGEQGTSKNADGEHLYMGMTNSKYGGTNPIGKSKDGKRGLAISRVDGDEQIGYTIAHEMGHCFGLNHAPSPGADSGSNKIDDNYPYGGRGLAGGWGYTNIEFYNRKQNNAKEYKLHFLSEDASASSQIHWDIMSYLPVQRIHRNNRFSDYNAEFLKRTTTTPPTSAREIDQIPGVVLLPEGVYVFGPAAARLVENYYRDMEPLTKSIYRIDSIGGINAAPLDFTIPPTFFSDPDPDGDGTGLPDLIVTRIPRLKGITVDQ
jgi:hypothetical protein